VPDLPAGAPQVTELEKAILATARSADMVGMARRAGKSSMAKIISDFLATPGYSTAEASKFSGHDDYMAHLTGKHEVADEINKEMQKLITSIKDVIDQPNDWRFELNTPQSLTVFRSGQYRKDTFIGGEQFKLIDVYAGKRDGLIGKFKEEGGKDVLVTSAAGTIVEIPIAKATIWLDGFATFMDYAMNPPRDPAAVAEEAKAVAEQRLKENSNYGSW
jgi:hypothetical protein